MPIYEYRCSACEHQFDALQRMGDKPLKRCPECNANSVQRLISAPMVHVRGPTTQLPDKVADTIGESNRPGSRRFFGPPREEGLHAISQVGRNIVVHPNLAGPPPGSFGMEGRVVVVKDEKRTRDGGKPSPK